MIADILRIIFLTLLLTGLLAVSACAQTSEDPVFRIERLTVLIFMLIFSSAVLLYTKWAKKGKALFVRKIAGIDAVEEAVGRATEMGKPVLFIPGISDIDEIETIAGLSILGRVAKITARAGGCQARNVARKRPCRFATGPPSGSQPSRRLRACLAASRARSAGHPR